MALSMVGQEAGQFNDDLRSAAPAPEGPGVFGSFLSALPAGATRGVYAGSTYFDREPAEDESQFSERVRQARQTSREIRQVLKYSTRMDPSTYGTASQILFQFAEIGAAGLVGSFAAGPVGGAVAAGSVAGRERYLELREQGADESAATLSGIASGALMGVGFRMAPFYGMKTVTQVGSGVGINVAAGAADRYSTHKILQGAGYDQVAEHYQALDGQAIVVDALLGAAFPAIHKLGVRFREPTVEQTDAAMVATEQYQKDTSLPAYPKDNEELAVMQQKLDAAYEQLIVENRPVSQLDVGELPSGAVNESMIRQLSEAETVFRSAAKDDPELAGLYATASDALKYADDFLPPKRVDDGALFRGIKSIGQSDENGVLFTTPDKAIAEGYAGENGRVISYSAEPTGKTLDLSEIGSVAKMEKVYDKLVDLFGYARADEMVRNVKTNNADEIDVYSLFRQKSTIDVLRAEGYEVAKFKQVGDKGSDYQTVAVLRPERMTEQATAAAGQDYDMFLRSQVESITKANPEMVMTIDGERVSVKEMTTKLDEITTKAEQDAKLVNIAKACALTFGE